MGSNFSVIGVLDNIEDYIEHAIAGGTSVPAGKGTTVRWFGPSGAGVFVHLDKRDGVTCVTPVFDVQTPFTVRYGGYLSDDCPYCSAIQVELLEDGELLFPFNFQVADAVAIRDFLPHAGEMLDVEVAFFGQSPSLHADEAAFAEAQAEDELKYAPQSFIPAGMFGGPPSVALLNGIVSSAEVLSNEITGQNYIRATVDTLGIAATVLLDPADLPHHPEPGNVLGGEFWACGRVVGGLRSEPKKRSFLQRIIG